MLKFRFIKLECQDGKWRTFFPCTEQKLKKLIKKFNPKNCYISVNKFLNFKEYNKTYKYQNIPLQQYGLIDIDGQNFTSLTETQNYFIGIFKFLKQYNIHIEEIVMTNSTVGGFQILINYCCYHKFRKLIHNFPEKFMYIDKLFDDKRVRRLKGTWNTNHNSMAIPLFSSVSSYAYHLFLQGCLENHPQRFQISNPELQSKDLNISEFKELMKNPYHLSFSPHTLPLLDESNTGFNNHSSLECGEGAVLENHTHFGFLQPPYALGMPQLDKQLEDIEGQRKLLMGYCQYPYIALKNAKKGVFRQEADDNRGYGIADPPCEIKAESEIKSNLLCQTILKEISNSVYGTKGLYIPVLKMDRLTKSAIKRLKRLQRAYSLGDLYIMRHNIGFDAFGLKCLDYRRFEKVLRKHGKGLLFFQKYHHLWLYLGKMVGCLRSEANGSYSKPHAQFFRLQYSNLVGSERLKVYTAVIGEGFR